MDRVLGPLLALLWSSGYLAGAIGTASTSSLSLVLWRFLLAAAVLVAVAVVSRAPWPRGRRAWRDVLVAGVLLQGVQFGAAYSGLAMGVPPGLVAMVLSLSPVLVAVLSGPLFGERLSRLGRVGSGLAVAGTAVAGAEHLGEGGGPLGLALTVLGLAGFAGGMLYQKARGAAMDLRTGSAAQLLAGAAVVVPAALLVGQDLTPPATAAGIGAVGWLAVVNSLGGMTLLLVLLRRRSGAGASNSLHVVPALTAVLAVPVLGQPIGVWTVAGLAVGAVGVVLVGRGTAARATREGTGPAGPVPDGASVGGAQSTVTPRQNA